MKCCMVVRQEVEGGKSYGQLIDALLYALKYKGSTQLVLRRTFPELNRSLILKSYLLYPKDVCSYNSQQHRYTFKNCPSVIEFGYLDNDSSVSQYQSAEYDVIRFDELTHFTEFQYTYMISRVRGANDFPKCLKSTTNPGNTGHMWVKQRFIDNKIPNQIHTDKEGNTTIFIPARVQDNTFLMAADPNYVKRLEMLDEDTKRALLYGDWDIFAGQYFKQFRKDKHVIDILDIDLKSHYKRFRSIDWGFNDPCCVLWHCVLPDGHVVTYKELYINETLASDVAKKVVEMSEGENIDYTVVSPDMWAKRGNDSVHGESIAETFTNNGVVVIKADNNRIPGWQRIHEFLAVAPDGVPYWQVTNNCLNLVRTLPSLIHDDNKVEDVSDKCEDHCGESLRYGLMSRPRPHGVSRLTLPMGLDLPPDLIQDLEDDPEALRHYLSQHK